jgi:hypothetical protein
MSDEGLQGINSVLPTLHVFNETIMSTAIFVLFITQNVYHILSNKVVQTPTYLPVPNIAS